MSGTSASIVASMFDYM
ncbi:hypothetical protein F383_19134 [Gossypium arboreum]|uniref:Uncharacterized protein n=1 Tax=Gossypium arboreum TaxID=29729 RepID=A0A0B0NLA8_GOSAR|nr:hypothetical protein F383_19133 [Gossypium arboreum]KHG11851.1 hypothetical protein F383_19134 [Gossypium arboreum]